jgi:hypothetical protein
MNVNAESQAVAKGAKETNHKKSRERSAHNGSSFQMY